MIKNTLNQILLTNQKFKIKIRRLVNCFYKDEFRLIMDQMSPGHVPFPGAACIHEDIYLSSKYLR